MADVNPASFMPCTASPPIQKAISSLPRPIVASVCKNSSTKAWPRSRKKTRVSCGPNQASERATLPSDRSFVSYEDDYAHVTGPALSNDTNVYWDQTMLDVLFDYPIRSEQSRFSIHPAFARLGLRVVTVLQFLPATGGVRAFEFNGDPGLVHLDPSWRQSAARFVDL